MRHGANATIVGRKFVPFYSVVKPHLTLCRADRLAKAAQELSAATGQTCIPAQADVRQPKMLQDAVKKTIEAFGRIDFVICGAHALQVLCNALSSPGRQVPLVTSWLRFLACRRTLFGP